MNDMDRSRDRDYDRDTFRPDDPDLEAYEYEGEDSGVRMPLFVILALVVVGAIVGTWWLAYQQGVEAGRQEGQRFIAGEPSAVRERPAEPGGIQSPEESDVFGSRSQTSTDNGRLVPREEQIVELPSPRRVVDPTSPSGSTGLGEGETDFASGLGGTQPSVPAPGSSGSRFVPPPSTGTGSSTGINAPAPSSGASVPPPRQTIQPPATQTQPQVQAPAPQTQQPARVTPPPRTVQPSTLPPRQAQVPPPSAQPQVSAPRPSSETVGPPRPSATPPASGDFVVQLASLPSREGADQLWARLSSRFGSTLSPYQKDVQVADVRGTTYHRLRVGYFPSRDAAANLCQSLKSQGQDCLVASR